MSELPDNGHNDWLAAELADTLDEDFELQLSEPALSVEIRKSYNRAHPPPGTWAQIQNLSRQ